MIIYNVTVNVDDDVHDEWLTWMRDVHVPEVMQTGHFLENKIMRVLVEEEMGGKTYAFQYTCRDMDTFRAYEAKHAPALREDVEKKYGGKFVAFRTLLETVN